MTNSKNNEYNDDYEANYNDMDKVPTMKTEITLGSYFFSNIVSFLTMAAIIRIKSIYLWHSLLANTDLEWFSLLLKRYAKAFTHIK